MLLSDDDIGGFNNPIYLSSGSSGTPLNDAASTISSLSDMDLERALRELRANDARSGNAKAGPSRIKPPTAPRSPRAAGKRRRIDETLVSGYDYSERSKKKVHPTATASQSTLTTFIKTSPSSKNNSQGDIRLGGPSRNAPSSVVCQPFPKTAPGSQPAPSNQPGSQSSSIRKLGGSSIEDAIELDSDSPSNPQPASRGHGSRPSSRLRSRPPSVQVKSATPKRQRWRPNNSSLPIVVSDSDDEIPAPRPSQRGLTSTLSPQKSLRDQRILVPETIVSPVRGRILVDETVPPRPRNTTTIATQTTLVPDSAVSSAGAVVCDDSVFPEPGPLRRHCRSRSAVTPEERRERQRRANQKAMTPAPIPELPSILDGLAKTPTPKKPAPRETAPPPDLNPSRRRLFTANLDDESYRPNPGTAFARPVKPAKVAAYQASRPRRSVPEQGKYALPAVDTPIHQWPSKPGTSHNATSSKRKSTEHQSKTPAPIERKSKTPVAAQRRSKTPAATERNSKTPIPAERKSSTPTISSRNRTPALRTPSKAVAGLHSPAKAAPHKQTSLAPIAPKSVTPSRTPVTSQRRRSRSLSSCLTPLPPTQLPVRSPANIQREPSASSPHTLPLEVEQSASRKGGETPGAVAQALPLESEAEGAGSAIHDDDDGSDFGLDMYADFAQFAGSPSTQPLLNTPSKCNLIRPSSSPVAMKTSRSPMASEVGVVSGIGPSSPYHHIPRSSGARLRSSQSPLSPTARLQAEDHQRERKLAEEREHAQQAAAQREAENRARLMAMRFLEGDSDQSDDEQEIRLSQIFHPSPGPRRSTRQRHSISKVSDYTEDLPQRPQLSPNNKHALLFKELDRDVKRGTTTAHIEAACSASASPERRKLDLASISGVDGQVLAEARRVQLEAARKEEQEAVYAVFWEDLRLAEERPLLPFCCAYEDPAVEILEEVYDESTLCQLISCLPIPESTETVLNQWLLELAFCAHDEELAYTALERVLENIASARTEPVEPPEGLFTMMTSAWFQLGGKVRQSDRHFGRVARDRATASSYICRIASTAASNGWLDAQCTGLMLCHLSILASDSSTSAALRREIEATSAVLFEAASKSDEYSHMIAKRLTSLPLVPQVRALHTLGQRNSATRAAVRWVAASLLLPEDLEDATDGNLERPSVHHIVQALNCIEDEIRSEDAEYGRISNLLALWCAGLTDIDDGWARDPEAKLLVQDTVRVRDLVRENPEDPATSEVKGRLQLFHHIVNLHVQAATDREQRARVASMGLEVGKMGQTRLSFGLGESKDNEE
ncbi:unnamed protein product [Cutaneotrichosporon oleaginosum]